MAAAMAHRHRILCCTSRCACCCARCHVCIGARLHTRTGTGLTPATSVPGLGSPLPHLHRDWAHPCRIFAGTGLTRRTRADLPVRPQPCGAAVSYQVLFVELDVAKARARTPVGMATVISGRKLAACAGSRACDHAEPRVTFVVPVNAAFLAVRTQCCR